MSIVFDTFYSFVFLFQHHLPPCLTILSTLFIWHSTYTYHVLVQYTPDLEMDNDIQKA